MNITEKRFLEASGQRYMADGITLRCQAVSGTQVAKLQAERDDYDSPMEAFWPEAQCSRRVVPGMYVCKYHGGRQIAHKGLRMLDTMPIDLADKIRQLSENPSYLSSRDEILLMQARVWQLVEKLDSEEVGSEEAWEMVGLAIKRLRKGDTVSALDFLEQALEKTALERDTWREIKTTTETLADLRSTQTKTIKEMRMWASMEQVSNLVLNIQQIITDAGEKFIDNDSERIRYLQYVGDRIFRLINIGSHGVGEKPLLNSGTDKRTPV